MPHYMELKTFGFPPEDGPNPSNDARIATALEFIAHYLESIAKDMSLISHRINDEFEQRDIFNVLCDIQRSLSELHPSGQAPF